MRGKLRAALNWLRGFLEEMMGAQAYDEAAFQRQVRDLLDSSASAIGSDQHPKERDEEDVWRS